MKARYLFPKDYMADPSANVFNGRLYVYPGLDVGLDVVGPDGALVLIRSQDHDDVGLSGGFRNGLDFQALLLGLLDGLGGRTQADDHVDTGVTQVQRMGVALGTVTDDGNLLTFDREEGYLQGPLTLTVDGSEKAHYKIDECQEEEWGTITSSC